MSHLSILPTVLRDTEGLAASLRALGLTPIRGGSLAGFGGERQPVLLQVALEDDLALGWTRQVDGTLALVGDLQKISRSRSLQELLGCITRGYAARMALAAAEQFTDAHVSVSP
ncbi:MULTISPECIES: DUF1257 domain-containing protein [Aphanothece]|uniref:DUF1257 domain-containing protein n=1 Tax=Aphanothece TaxID=1121 RepID=UPI003984A066